MMNYIELISQFWQTRRSLRITSSEADLYFCLLQECNMRNWQNPFECSNGLICGIIGIDEKTLFRARNGLQQKGLIEFEKGDRNVRPANYTIPCPQFNGNFSGRKGSTVGGRKGSNIGGRNGSTPIIKQNKTKHKPPISPPLGDPELPLDKKNLESEKEICVRIVQNYNDTCKALRPVKTLTDKRRGFINARLKEHGEQAVLDAIKAASESDFLAGQNTRLWTADFDWIFQPTNFVKILERKYDNKQRTPNSGGRNGSNDRQAFGTGYNADF